MTKTQHRKHAVEKIRIFSPSLQNAEKEVDDEEKNVSTSHEEIPVPFCRPFLKLQPHAENKLLISVLFLCKQRHTGDA